MNDCYIPGLSEVNDVLGNDVLGWVEDGVGLVDTVAEAGKLAYTAASSMTETLCLATYLTGADDLAGLASTLGRADELAETASTFGRVSEAIGPWATGLGIVGAVGDGLSLAQNLACGDYYAAGDDAISLGLGVAGLVLGMATPVGWAVAGAGLLWAGAQLLSGDVPVTERIGDFFGSLFG